MGPLRPALKPKVHHEDFSSYHSLHQWCPNTWWRHQMETFPRYWPFVRGIHRSPVNSPHKGQWRGALMFSLICVWIKGWVNNGEAGDLRRYLAHYDVTVMMWQLAVGDDVRQFVYNVAQFSFKAMSNFKGVFSWHNLAALKLSYNKTTRAVLKRALGASFSVYIETKG